MKKIVVFFKQPGAKDYPFNKQEYWNAYQELEKEIQLLGAEFYVVRSQGTYLGNGRFAQSWKFEDGDLVESGEVIADIIYDKGEFVSDDTVDVLNSHFINDICTNKWRTYELFPSFCPKTVLVHSEEEFLEELPNLNGDKKVIKPLDDEEGNGVFIGDDDYIKKSPREFPLLVQEFLDSSDGIPGIVEGIHDLRVAIMSGEILFSFVRTPPEGELLANVARGGNLFVLKPEEIPQEAMDLVYAIDKSFKEYKNRFYGVDIAFTPDGPKIIELNSRLGLQENERHEVFVSMKKALAKLLVS